MTYTILGGNVQTRQAKLTTTGATVIVDGGNNGATVIMISAAEIAGSTPSLTLEKYDGTTSFYLRNAKAMTAREQYQSDMIVVLKAGEQLRATASAANQIDIIASYLPGDKTAKGSGF